ncbi:hypothetical protein OG897_27410 [Streptomyces sp. NBC_00237]|uniref:hypothetical protein n=1 Tax=Streptomyces sp. NBC_00237 TaxID=2975687 RepID=UPI00225224CE|nr:hypothetical protein [Streptomyces sp. NBC_00237]MCX5205172.1 hypothetical protein [Streptomyces sp. NBC_00237]
MPEQSATSWFSARTVYRHRDLNTYEERITLWHVTDSDAAMAAAEQEAAEYCEGLDGTEYLGFVQTFALFSDEGAPGIGSEVFSLMRDSELAPDAYLDRHFDTGGERAATTLAARDGSEG